MSNKRRLQKQWQNFEKTVIPKNASAVQKQEMRRAFYAGAFMMLELAKEFGDDDISEDAAVEALEGLEQELKEFQSLICIKY